MPRIAVDLDALHDAATSLTRAMAVANEVSGSHRRLSSLAQGCGPLVAGAIEAFLSHWGHGMEIVAGDGEQLVKALTRATEAYHAADTLTGPAGS
jgi:uncharacterized protein DUF6507